MRVFVTGGTGAIGRHAIPNLVAAGHEVSALARSEAKAQWLREQGAAPVELSLFDSAALSRAFAGHEAVVNLATAIPPMRRFMSAQAWAANQRVRTDGSSAVVEAAIGAGIGRVVQESVCMLYANGGAQWLNEDAPTDRYPMAEGSHAAEMANARFRNTGGVGVVLRFGWIYGPGAAHSEQMLAQARRHVILTIGDPDGYQSSIHVHDAAAAIVASLEIPSGVYNAVDDEPLTKRGFAAALAAAASRTPWVRGPGRLACLFGDHLTAMTRSVRASNALLRSRSGWTPRYPSAKPGSTDRVRVEG